MMDTLIERTSRYTVPVTLPSGVATPPPPAVNIHVVGQLTGSWAAREVVSGADHGRVRSFIGGRVVLISGRVV